MNKKLAQALKRLRRWVFRLCGGYHQSEHAEIVHAELVKAEREAAMLRLQVNLLDRRRIMLAQMIKGTWKT